MRVPLALQLPHPGQVRLDRECARFNVVSCGRRFGKTQHGINRAITHPKKGLLAGAPVGWFAPTYKYLDEAFRDVLRIIPESLIKHQNMNDRRIELWTGGVLEGWTTEGGDPGRSRKYALGIYDEAAKDRRLMDVWQKSIRPTLADLRGEAWFYTTPRGIDDFHELHLRGVPGPKAKKNWKSWIMPTSTNPYILGSEIADARDELSDLVFRQEFLAEFIAEAGEYFLRQWFDGKLYDPTSQAFLDGIQLLRRFLTIDLAISTGEERDYTVISPFGVNYKRDLLWLPGTTRIRERDGKTIAVAIVDSIATHKPEIVVVEDGHIWRGVKASVEEEMRRRNKWATFKEVTPSRAGNDPSREAKQARARSFQAMAQWGRIYLPDDAFTMDHLLPELLSFPTGKHDDIVDTGAMAANHLQEEGDGKPPPEPEKPPPPRSHRALGIDTLGKKPSARGGLRRRSALRR